MEATPARLVRARRIPSHTLVRSGTLVLLLLAGAVAATGCSLVRPGADSPFGQSRPSQIRLIVFNDDFNDVTLVARRGDDPHRLGVVTGKTGASYVLEWPISQPLRVEITMMTGGSCTTESIHVDPGEVIELQIQNGLMQRGQCTGMRGASPP